MIRPHALNGRSFAGLRIGLLGGSFNPAHDGHLAISLHALRLLRLDAVWWLVSPQNPLKAKAGMLPLAERLARARGATRAHPRLQATALETALGTRYTVDTLSALRQRYPTTRFVWLMGADNLLQLSHWHHWQRIMNVVPVAVLARAPYSLQSLGGKAAQRYRRCRLPAAGVGLLAASAAPAWVFLPIPLHPASATAIRASWASAKGTVEMGTPRPQQVTETP